MKDFFQEIKDDADISLNDQFKVAITDARVVPSVEDAGITFEDLDNFEKKCKEIETVVLYADLRDSTKISNRYSREDLVKIYSTFITTTIRCIQYNGGYVRNIVGDRVMAVFDSNNCFKKSIETAFTINSSVNYLLNTQFPTVGFKCGIGLDFGTMLVTKTGIIKRNKENAPNRSLVWLGVPANIASKLTDLANKTVTSSNPTIEETWWYPYSQKIFNYKLSPIEFIKELSSTNSRNLLHRSEYFYKFSLQENNKTNTSSPILITKRVYEGFKNECPNDASIQKNWWSKQDVKVPGYSDVVYGCDVIYSSWKEIS